jgi:hypothetical protein
MVVIAITVAERRVKRKIEAASGDVAASGFASHPQQNLCSSCGHVHWHPDGCRAFVGPGQLCDCRGAMQKAA